MKLDKIYLLVTISYSTKTGEYFTKWPNKGGSLVIKDGTIYHFDIDGKPKGFSSKMILEPIITNEFWKENTEQILLYDEFTANNKTYLTLCYLLNPKVLNFLISNRKDFQNNDKSRDLFLFLIKETFPDLQEMSIEWDHLKVLENFSILNNTKPSFKLLIKNQSANKYDTLQGIDFLESFLIVVPSESEIENLNLKQESPSDFLVRFEMDVKRDLKDELLVPYYDVDYIETIDHKYIYGIPIKLRIFICTILNGNKKDICLPWAISNAHELVIKNNLLKDIKEILNKTYANRTDIQAYINSISDRDIFKNYLYKFNNERLDYLQAKFEIEESINSYKASVLRTYPYKHKDNYETLLLKDICKSNYRSSWSYVQKSNNDFDRLISNVNDTLISISNKDLFITNFLRDNVSAESMWINLKIQKSIKWLTFFAVTFALLSLFIAIFNTEIKAFIFNSIRLLFT